MLKVLTTSLVQAVRMAPSNTGFAPSVCWLKVLVELGRPERISKGHRNGACSQCLRGRGLGNLLCPKFSLRKSPQHPDKGFVGKREHKHKSRWSTIENGENYCCHNSLCSHRCITDLKYSPSPLHIHPRLPTLTNPLHCAHRWHLLVPRLTYLVFSKLCSSLITLHPSQ